uniref:Uncharacterized protein n=1 Tax=Meloidogyne incognita TaxID=6306 RepID=A0A914MVQ6_MELIC
MHHLIIITILVVVAKNGDIEGIMDMVIMVRRYVHHGHGDVDEISKKLNETNANMLFDLIMNN